MDKPLYILGLTHSGHHDSAATLLKDGVLVAAVEENRFSRKKGDRSFPIDSINYCLKEAGITIHEIDHVGFFWQPWRGLFTRAQYAIRGLPQSLGRGGTNARILRDLFSARHTLNTKTGYRGDFHFLEHHITHAASTFFTSPYEHAAILSIDGSGESDTTWIGEGHRTALSHHVSSSWPHSLGHLYATATQFLGFSIFEDEYKVMGLAAYGKPTHLHVFRDIMRVEDGRLRIDLRYVAYHHLHTAWYSSTWIDAFGEPRRRHEPITEHHKNIAASLQARTEEILLELARYARDRSGATELCLSGGVALNAVALGKLAESGIFEKVFTNPVSGDSGCALGSALYIHHVLLKNAKKHTMHHAAWGPSFTNDEIEHALVAERIPYERVANPTETAADLISKGLVIGWFQGRAEYGERALGNRSILADPRTREIRDRINALVKHREAFRPFAPSILAEYQHDYFDWHTPSPFMTEVHSVRPEKRSLVPAVIHEDGSARLQTVTQNVLPLYYELIHAFFVRTGIPLILNTSFNESGEPIVGTPRDAVRTFLRCHLDALVIGTFLVLRRNDVS